jgi:hypothetical protein
LARKFLNLFIPSFLDHFYTASAEEKDAVVRAGGRYVRIVCYLFIPEVFLIEIYYKFSNFRRVVDQFSQIRNFIIIVFMGILKLGKSFWTRPRLEPPS